MNFGEIATRDLRLVLLRALEGQPAFRANENVLAMEAQAFGHKRAREAIRTELNFLESLGAVRVVMHDPVMVAELTRKGQDHIDGLTILDGVLKPSPRA